MSGPRPTVLTRAFSSSSYRSRWNSASRHSIAHRASLLEQRSSILSTPSHNLHDPRPNTLWIWLNVFKRKAEEEIARLIEGFDPPVLRENTTSVDSRSPERRILPISWTWVLSRTEAESRPAQIFQAHRRAIYGTTSSGSPPSLGPYGSSSRDAD